MTFTWIRLQSEVGRWVEKNFPAAPPSWQMWGLIEETGELDEARVLSALPAFGKIAHAHLKAQQGIRGSAEKHAAAARDAVADSVIFFMHACSGLQWASQEVLRSATPEEFQATFSVPQKRSPITHTLKYLAAMIEQLEFLENAPTAIEKDAYLAGAKTAALGYLSGLAAYCTQRNWSLQAIIDEVWPRVCARDWTKNKVDGGEVKLDIPVESLAGVIEEVGLAVANPNIKKVELVSGKEGPKEEKGH